jgi:hypothetical protein
MENLAIEPDRLPPHLYELECAIRSFDTEGKTAKEAKKLLKLHMDEERQGNVNPPPLIDDPEEILKELNIISDAIPEIKITAKSLEENPSETGVRKFKTLLAHYYARLTRLVPTTQKEADVIKQSIQHLEAAFARISGGEDEEEEDEIVPHAQVIPSEAPDQMDLLTQKLQDLGDAVTEIAEIEQRRAKTQKLKPVKLPTDAVYYVPMTFDATQIQKLFILSSVEYIHFYTFKIRHCLILLKVTREIFMHVIKHFIQQQKLQFFCKQFDILYCLYILRQMVPNAR